MTSSKLKGRSPLKGASLLDEFEKDRIKSQTDIVSVITSYGIALEKKGSSHMGLCPFHEDKNPSLSVDQSKGLFHCFGCGAGGDVFDFVMRHQGVEFKEALAILKGDEGKAFRPKEVPAPPVPLEGESLLKTTSLEDVADYYHRQLSHPEAVSYMKKRGIYAPELLGRLKVGYCPERLERQTVRSPVSGAERGGPSLRKRTLKPSGTALFSHSILPMGKSGDFTAGS